MLENNKSLGSEKTPSHAFYTTGDANKFSKVASKLTNKNIKAKNIDLGYRFKDKKIGIVGLGIEGFSSAKLLLKKGANVTILDKKEEVDLDKEIIKEIKKLPVRLVLGKDCLKNLNNFEIIIYET